jgi:short-subunit dehydrogenase
MLEILNGQKAMKTEVFKEKIVIITGASSGIGKALALRLAEKGAWLMLAARNIQRLNALATECKNKGAKAKAIPTNVADESQCKILVQETIKEYGKIDTIINNAGIDVVSKLDELNDLNLFKQVMDVNFYGTVYCTFYALPFLKKTMGRIINISSLGGMLAIPLNTSYVASKFAIGGFSDSLRMELVNDGVSVTVVCPSWVATEFHERYMDKDGQPKGPSGRKIYTKKTMSADQCAQIILKAAQKRKRQIVMHPGSIGIWIKLIAPNIVDRLILSFLRPAIRRASDGDGS